MTKKTFKPEDKARAMQLVKDGELTYAQIADLIGCSPKTIENWRQMAKAKKGKGKPAKKAEGPKRESAGGSQKPAAPKTKPAAGLDTVAIKKKFWGKGTRAVDMLVTPKDASPEELKKLVDEAIDFAVEQTKK